MDKQKNNRHNGQGCKTSYAQKTVQIFRKIMLCVMTVVCVLTIISMMVIINRNNTTNLRYEVEKLSGDINSTILAKASYVEALAALAESGAAEGYDEELALVDATTALDSLISAVYIARPDESLVYSGGWLPDPDFVLTNRLWYTGAVATDGVYLTDPYVDETTGQFCVTLSKAVKNGSTVQFIVGLDLYLDNVIQMVSDTYSGDAYSFLASADGTIMAHPDGDIALSASHSETLATALGGEYSALQEDIGSTNILKDYDGHLKVMMVNKLDSGWYVVSVTPVSDQIASLMFAFISIVVVYVAAVLVSSVVCRRVITRWFKPFETITNKMSVISSGNLKVQFEEQPITTEIEMLTDALNTTISHLQSYISDISHVLRNVARGNLTVHKHVDYTGDFLEIEEALDVIVDNLNDTIAKVIDNAERVNDCSRQVQESTEQVAEGATAQNMAITELADHIRVLADKINMITESAESANTISNETNGQLSVGNTKMQEVVGAMDEIARMSIEIENITETINKLASQTNLLALNASIEAARAGDAGRGFAVVAEQIGTLAQASSEASMTIENLINNTRVAVDKGKHLVNETADTIAVGVTNSIQLGDKLGDITEAVETQNEALEKIATGVDEISNVIQTNAAVSQENAAISHELIQRSDALHESVSQFVLTDN